MIVGDLQQLFEITRLPHEAVRVVREDVAHSAFTGLREKRVPPRPLALPLPRRPVVVHEHLVFGDHKAQTVGQFAADALLALHAGLVVVVHMRDAAVDRGGLARPVRAVPLRPLRASRLPGTEGAP